MAIKFNCQKCSKELVVKDEMAGKVGKCPNCKTAITVPAAAASAVKTAPVKKKPADDKDVVDAEVAEDEVVSAEFVDDEDDSPSRKKKKSRRDEDDDDDRRITSKKPSRRRDEDDDNDEDDDRPSRKKASSPRRDDDDDDDEDDRPSRKRSSSRRDEDDEDEDDEPRKKQNPKKRRAAFRRASVGVLLSTIGQGLQAGGIFISIIAVLVLAAMSGSKTGGGGGLGFLKVISWVSALTLLAGFILHAVGTPFTITTPSKNGEIGLSIASTATAGLSLLLFFVLFADLFFSAGDFGGLGAAFGFIISFLAFNPFTGFSDAGMVMPGSRGLSFAIYILPLTELGRLTCFTLYQWAVGKSQKDRSLKSKGFLMAILSPSIVAGAGLIFWIIQLTMKNSRMTSMWGPAMIMTFYGLLVIGGLVCAAIVMLSSRSTLQDAD